MDLRTRILEDQAVQANAGQVQSNPEALATIGKVIAGLAMKAHFNDLNAFLKEFKDTEVFQTLLKNNSEAVSDQSFEEIMKSNEFKTAMQQADSDGSLFKNKDFTLAEVLKACFSTKKGSQSYTNVHNAFKRVFGFDYADIK